MARLRTRLLAVWLAALLAVCPCLAVPPAAAAVLPLSLPGSRVRAPSSFSRLFVWPTRPLSQKQRWVEAHAYDRPASDPVDDNNGNMTLQADGTTTTTLGYNPLNQMTSQAVNGSTTSFKYAPDGSRYSRTDPNNTVTTYVTDPLTTNVWAEYVGTTLTAKNVHSDGVDELLARIEGNASYQALQDGLGSITGLTDSTGAVVAGYSYSAWGQRTQTSGTLSQPFGFAGREHEGTAIYNRARFLMPGVGRWNAADSIGFAGGDVNLHRYVGNNPTNATDPSGLWVWMLGGAVAGMVANGISQYANGGNFCLSEIVQAGLFGALGGTYGSWVGKLLVNKLALNVLMNSLGAEILGIIQQVYKNKTTCEKNRASWDKDLLKAAFLGAVFGALGTGLGALAGKALDKDLAFMPPGFKYIAVEIAATTRQVEGGRIGLKNFSNPIATSIGYIAGNAVSTLIGGISGLF